MRSDCRCKGRVGGGGAGCRAGPGGAITDLRLTGLAGQGRWNDCRLKGVVDGELGED